MTHEQPTPAERAHARGMLKVRDGSASGIARRTRVVAGSLVLVAVAGFVGLAASGWLPALAFLAGAVGGAAGCVWVAARQAEVRHRIALRVCDWDLVERLASGEPAEPGAAPDPARM